MANPALFQKKKGKYLWFALHGLGFQPDTAISSFAKLKINVKHINLGPNMFDKPNKGAAYIVIHFLLVKLNSTRFQDAYRHCWPVLDHKADAEFRKVTCAWLREIMDEIANAGSKVVASLFLSPGGPKFISLMLQLANHVMLQEMKSFTKDDCWVSESAAMPASSLDMAVKRFNLTTKRFLKTAVDQDRFLLEYQRRAPLLVKSMRDFREDGTKYNELLKRYSSDSVSEELSSAEKTKKVRSLWADIDQMLSTIKEEQSSVASVLKGDVDQYVLDGTDRVLKVPRSLLERIEQLPHQLSSGNVYEAGQLNLLCVLELMNHALHVLRDERRRLSDAPKSDLNPRHLQEKCQQMGRVLQDLHLIRQKISKEQIPGVRNSISEMETEWDRKWMDTIEDAPLDGFLNEDPALGFLSPMAPLSFKPAAEATYRSSVFSQYPAKLLEEKPAVVKSQDVINLSFSNLKSSFSERSESPIVTTEASSRVNTSLDWLFDTPPSPPLGAPALPQPQANVASVKTTTSVHPKVAPARTKTQILDMEYDNLADQFADAVTTASPTEGTVRSLDLEGLLSTLHGDPFSTRKQLPRTPERLILDVKNSWRKALEEDKVKKKLNESTTPPSFQELHVSMSPDTPTVVTPSSPPVCQQEASFKSTMLWDTFNSDSLGSSAVQFSLNHETLPEMPECDSMLSFGDDVVELKSEEEEELLFPFIKTEAEQPPLNAANHWFKSQQVCEDGSFIENKERTLSGHNVSGLERDWLSGPVKSVEASAKVFSLDLDSLEMPSPPKQDYCLPQLITFSPIDDLKF
ncbi:HAUS augmin-like complex subunit 6 [Solea solea]|uniref:HAUS augmin-like complex subunit 6 n=1 Tax=Solea solea TaxID=90069 RepID=UPI00272CCEB3|nr:HAUS augmin-like complex subunit 6 [Solea solea]